MFSKLIYIKKGILMEVAKAKKIIIESILLAVDYAKDKFTSKFMPRQNYLHRNEKVLMFFNSIKIKFKNFLEKILNYKNIDKIPYSEWVLKKTINEGFNQDAGVYIISTLKETIKSNLERLYKHEIGNELLARIDSNKDAKRMVNYIYKNLIKEIDRIKSNIYTGSGDNKNYIFNK